MEGTCLCKAITVKVADDNLFGSEPRGHICHCANCRKVAGSAVGATNLIIETEKVTIIGEEKLKCYDDYETTSGNPVHRWFCPTCGVPIRSVVDALKGKTILKLGIFPNIPKPAWESFASHRQDWHHPVEGVETQYHLLTKGELWKGKDDSKGPAKTES